MFSQNYSIHVSSSWSRWVFSLTALTNRVEGDVTWVSAAVMMPFFSIFFFCHAHSQVTVLQGDWGHLDWALAEHRHRFSSHVSKFTWMGFPVPSQVAPVSDTRGRSRPFMWVLSKLYSQGKKCMISVVSGLSVGMSSYVTAENKKNLRWYKADFRTVAL